MEVCEVWRNCDSPEYPIFTYSYMLHAIGNVSCWAVCVYQCMQAGMAVYRMTLSQTRMEFLPLRLQQPKLYLGICIIIIIPDESTFV